MSKHRNTPKPAPFGAFSGPEVTSPEGIEEITGMPVEEVKKALRRDRRKDPRDAVVVWIPYKKPMIMSFSVAERARQMDGSAIIFHLSEEMFHVLEAEKADMEATGKPAEDYSLPLGRSLNSCVGEIRMTHIRNTSPFMFIGQMLVKGAEHEMHCPFALGNRNLQDKFKGNILLPPDCKDLEFVLRRAQETVSTSLLAADGGQFTLEDLCNVPYTASKTHYSVPWNYPPVQNLEIEIRRLAFKRNKFNYDQYLSLKNLPANKRDVVYEDIKALRMARFGTEKSPEEFKKDVSIPIKDYEAVLDKYKKSEQTTLTLASLRDCQIIFRRAHRAKNPFTHDDVIKGDAMSANKYEQDLTGDPEFDLYITKLAPMKGGQRVEFCMNQKHVISFVLEVQLGDPEYRDPRGK